MAWPSLRRIEGETGLARNTVIKYLAVLSDSQWLITKKNAHPLPSFSGQQMNNEYIINIPAEVVHEMHHLLSKVVQPMTRGGSSGDIEVVHLVHHNNNINNNTNNNKHIGHSDRFNDFWKAYPKKVKKADALKKWKSKRLDNKADEIITDVQIRITDDPRWKETQFIPDPTTYLNGERWNDEINAPEWKRHAVP